MLLNIGPASLSVMKMYMNSLERINFKATFFHLLYLFICMAPAVYVGILGLDRPYDSFPDQDLIWVSEALRIARGVAPSYADHPGAFWALMFRINLKLIRVSSDFLVIDAQERITTEGINLLIKLSRVENFLLVGSSGYLLFLTSLSLGINRYLSAISGIIFSFSSGILAAATLMRHEVPSVCFLLLSFLAFSYVIRFKMVGRALRLSLVSLAVILFFSAAFSKTQALLLAPLYFLALIYISFKFGAVAEVRGFPKSFSGKSHLLLKFATISLVIWAIASFPGLKIVNGVTWMMINLLMSLVVCIGACRYLAPTLLFKSLILVGLFEVFIFKIILPQWWVRAVARFPLWLTQYGSPAGHTLNDLIALFLQGVRFYFGSLSISWTFSAICSFLLVGGCFLRFWCSGRRYLFQSNCLSNSIPFLAWSYVCLLLLVFSLRLNLRYDAYILPPLLLLSLWHLNEASSFWVVKARGVTVLALTISAGLLVLSLAIKSVANVAHPGMVSASYQPRQFLCFGQHMDRTMSLTTAGKCRNFSEASIDKDRFDYWSGPF